MKSALRLNLNLWGICLVLVLTSAALLTSALSASAQALNPTLATDVVASKGIQPNRSYFSPEPWEHFDPLSGNIVLTFTDLVLPGNAGRPLPFQRTFNNQPSGGPGPFVSRWTFGFPGIPMRVVDQSAVPGSFVFSTDPATLLEQMLPFTPLLMMADGSYVRTVFSQRPNATAPLTLNQVRSSQFFEYRAVSTISRQPGSAIYCSDPTMLLSAGD
jgi:hypothetical protein